MDTKLHSIPSSELSDAPLKVLPVLTHKITPTFSLKRVSTTPKTLTSLISSTSQIHSILTKTDISPGEYEGGFTCWECSRNLCEYLLTMGMFFPEFISLHYSLLYFILQIYIYLPLMSIKTRAHFKKLRYDW